MGVIAGVGVSVGVSVSVSVRSCDVCVITQVYDNLLVDAC